MPTSSSSPHLPLLRRLKSTDAASGVVTGKEVRTLRLWSAALASCRASASAYGACVLASSPSVEQNACAVEYDALRRCMREQGTRF